MELLFSSRFMSSLLAVSVAYLWYDVILFLILICH